MSLYFDSLEALYAHFEDDCVLDELIDTEEWGGKHDCTEHSGYYFQPSTDSWWLMHYSASYNNGIEGVSVEGPFSLTQQEVVITKNIWKRK